jgi:acyl-CoA reductase-like NAD-dependent aldehyde dehydrogenase
MYSYPLYIDGKDTPGGGWVYTMRASAMIRNPRAAFSTKRKLEMNADVEPSVDVVGRCARADTSHNLAAIAAAHRASRQYRTFSLNTRRQIVAEIHDATRERVDELIDILIAEGHPRRLAQWEVSGMLLGTERSTLDWYVSQLEHSYSAGDHRVRLVRKPDGVVCVNPPQNAAGSNSMLGIFALLGGNTLVVKVPRSSPLSVMFVYRDIVAPVLERHGAPPGTLNLVCMATQPALRTWLSSPDVDDLLFFGDSATGIGIGEDWIRAGKKPVLELAGNDGVLVWHDADLAAAARALTECFYGSGQICMVPKYAVVHPDVASQLLDHLLRLVGQIRPGYPENPDVLLSPVLKSDRYLDYLAEARSAGCAVLTGGRRVDVDGRPDVEGVFCEPAVVRVDTLETARNLSCVRHETFFPLLPIVVPERSGSNDELLCQVVDFMDTNTYGLRNSLWTNDEEVVDFVVANLNNGGQIKINDSHIGFVPGLATHGGNGITGGPFGELNYVGLRTTHLQGICWGNGNPQPLAAEGAFLLE